MIARGIALRGFFTSSPVVAMQSNPTNPKKQVAAPRIVPSNPQGKKPPAPAVLFCGRSEAGISQFLMLAERSIVGQWAKWKEVRLGYLHFIDPATMTISTIATFSTVKQLFRRVDCFKPNARATEIEIQIWCKY